MLSKATWFSFTDGKKGKLILFFIFPFLFCLIRVYSNWFNVAGFGLWLQKPVIKILTRVQALPAFVSFQNVA